MAYVDAYTLFTDAEGKYAVVAPPARPTRAPRPVPVRSGDGVHFTPQGGERLAQAVYGVLDAQCRITAQAVPGVVKGTIETEGSTQVVGGTGRPGTVQTSPPASGSADPDPRRTDRAARDHSPRHRATGDDRGARHHRATGDEHALNRSPSGSAVAGRR